MKKIILLLAVIFVITSYSQRKIKWVAIGDSITYLNDHKNETGNRITKGYITRVVEKLTNVEYINKGYNGWTSGEIADSIDYLGLKKADVYSVFLGTNDWWAGRKIGSFSDYQNNTGNNTVYGSFRIIMNKLKILNKDARIILITPMQRADFVYIADNKNNAYGSYKDKDGQSLSQFVEAIKTIGKFEKLPVVDLYNEPRMRIEKLVKYKRLKDPQTNTYKNYPYPQYIGIPFNPSTDEYPYPVDAIEMTFDGLHPSNEGCEIIAEKLIDIIEKYN